MICVVFDPVCFVALIIFHDVKKKETESLNSECFRIRILMCPLAWKFWKLAFVHMVILRQIENN